MHAIVQIGDASGIAPGDNHSRLIATGSRGSSDLLAHLFNIDNLLASQMPTAFGAALILELNRRSSCFFQQTHAAAHLLRTSKSRVCIDHQRDAHRSGQHPSVLDQLLKRNDADIRHAQHASRQRSAREINGLTSLLLGQLGHECDGGAVDRNRAIRGALLDEPTQDNASAGFAATKGLGKPRRGNV